MSLCVYMLL